MQRRAERWAVSSALLIVALGSAADASGECRVGGARVGADVIPRNPRIVLDNVGDCFLPLHRRADQLVLAGPDGGVPLRVAEGLSRSGQAVVVPERILSAGTEYTLWAGGRWVAFWVTANRVDVARPRWTAAPSVQGSDFVGDGAAWNATVRTPVVDDGAGVAIRVNLRAAGLSEELVVRRFPGPDGTILIDRELDDGWRGDAPLGLTLGNSYSVHLTAVDAAGNETPSPAALTIEAPVRRWQSDEAPAEPMEPLVEPYVMARTTPANHPPPAPLHPGEPPIPAQGDGQRAVSTGSAVVAAGLLLLALGLLSRLRGRRRPAPAGRRAFLRLAGQLPRLKEQEQVGAVLPIRSSRSIAVGRAVLLGGTLVLVAVGARAMWVTMFSTHRAAVAESSPLADPADFELPPKPLWESSAGVALVTSPPSTAPGAHPSEHCLPITNDVAARCYRRLAPTRARNERVLRNLIIAHRMLDDWGTTSKLAALYWKRYPRSPFLSGIRPLVYGPDLRIRPVIPLGLTPSTWSERLSSALHGGDVSANDELTRAAQELVRRTSGSR